MSEDTLEIEAEVTEWRTGDHGYYALVRVLSADSPVKSALCAQDVKGVTPVLGIPFRCRVKQTSRGWRVAEIIVNGLPCDLTDVAGIVRTGPVFKGGSQVWTFATEPLPDGVTVAAEMDTARLRDVYLAEIDVGASVRFNAVRGPRGYEVTKLLRPTPAEAFPSSPADVPRQTVVALVGHNWTADGPKKGVVVRLRSAAGAPVSASAFVRASMLRAAGLKQLFRASGSTPPLQADSEEMLSEWQAALHSNGRDASGQIEVDRIEVEVEWVASSSQWRVERLLRPRALRLPSGSGEVVDWVHGTVLGQPCKLARAASQVRPTQSEGAREGQEELDSTVQLVSVEVEYDDARLGHGTASLRLTEHKAQAAGLSPGTAVTVCLKSREDYWNIAMLHRALPSEAEALP